MERISKVYGNSFCSGGVGDPVLSHTQKQETIRENEIRGKQEARRNEWREVTECEVMHAACAPDKG